jgi:hypothetical protein
MAGLTLCCLPLPAPQVNYGQQLRVVGNAPGLGGWDTARGLHLKWSEGHVWSGEVELDAGSHVEFKVTPGGGGLQE